MATEPVAGATTRADSSRGSEIRREAAKLFTSRGFHQTSLQDIANIIGITKSALYYFYPSKDHIIDDILLRTIGEMDDRMRSAVAAQCTPSEKLRAFFATHTDYIAENYFEFAATYLGFAGRSDTERAAWIEKRDAYERRLRDILALGVEQGDFRQCDPVTAGRAMLSSLNGLARWWRPDGARGIEEFATAYFELFYHGVART